jgi:hypothetical protein
MAKKIAMLMITWLALACGEDGAVNETIVDTSDIDTNIPVDTEEPPAPCGDYEDGEVYEAEDGCNVCFCQDGKVICTGLDCTQGVVDYYGRGY